MSREFKFRIYSFISKSFIYFDIYDYPQGIAGGVSEPQQFTGLKDKNGKEVYEGDILNCEIKATRSKIKCVVKWQAYSWYYCEIGGESIPFAYRSNVEVIGNIFEQPETAK